MVSRLRSAVTALSALSLALLPGIAHAAPGDTVVLPVRDALAGLPTQVEDRTGYVREAFRHWIDEDRDQCSTRAEVLIEEAVVPPAVGSNCALLGGAWNSVYDGRQFTAAGDLDIDHVVALAEAWDSGASAWIASERQAFANDLGDAR
jgi:hypothetical protein